jgi:hypothetical protein
MFAGVLLIAAKPEEIARAMQSALGVTWQVVGQSPLSLELQMGGAKIVLVESSLSDEWGRVTTILDFVVDDVVDAVVRFERAGRVYNSRITMIGERRFSTVELGSGIQLRLIEAQPAACRPAVSEWGMGHQPAQTFASGL